MRQARRFPEPPGAPSGIPRHPGRIVLLAPRRPSARPSVECTSFSQILSLTQMFIWENEPRRAPLGMLTRTLDEWEDRREGHASEARGIARDPMCVSPQPETMLIPSTKPHNSDNNHGCPGRKAGVLAVVQTFLRASHSALNLEIAGVVTGASRKRRPCRGLIAHDSQNRRSCRLASKSTGTVRAPASMPCDKVGDS